MLVQQVNWGEAGVTILNAVGPGKNMVSGGISLFPDPGCGPTSLNDLEQVIAPSILPLHQTLRKLHFYSPILQMRN